MLSPLHARADTHTHTPLEAGLNTCMHAQTYTLTQTHTPSLPKKPTYPQVIFHSILAVFCSPTLSGGYFSPSVLLQGGGGERPHAYLKTLLDRNHVVQNKESQGYLNLNTRQPVAIFKLVLFFPPLRASCALSLPLSFFFACPATAQHTSIIHCLSPGFQAKPITDGVLLMGSCRTCQQAICAPSDNPPETIKKRIRFSFWTSHVYADKPETSKKGTQWRLHDIPWTECVAAANGKGGSFNNPPPKRTGERGRIKGKKIKH